MIIGRPISSNHFTYNSATKEFAIEASDLKGFPFDGLLYDDAADFGFVLVSEKTGRSQPYFLNQNIYNKENDIVAQEFLPAEPVLPGARGTSVLVFND